MKYIRLMVLATACAPLLLTGCAGVQRGAPATIPLLNVNLQRSDYEVLGPVEGASKRTSIAFGLVQIVEDDKLIVCGIKSFEDQYAFRQADTGLINVLFGWMLGVSADDRAYYKALAATPDADAVVPKSWTKTVTGIPCIYTMEDVKFTGKAIKIK